MCIRSCSSFLHWRWFKCVLGEKTGIQSMQHVIQCTWRFRSRLQVISWRCSDIYYWLVEIVRVESRVLLNTRSLKWPGNWCCALCLCSACGYFLSCSRCRYIQVRCRFCWPVKKSLSPTIKEFDTWYSLEWRLLSEIYIYNESAVKYTIWVVQGSVTFFWCVQEWMQEFFSCKFVHKCWWNSWLKEF